MDTYAPVALFVYNRPVHASRTLEALKVNEGASDTDLYIFADGPKPDASEKDVAAIRETRAVISSVKGFRNVFLKVSEKNIGLEKSIVSGINEVLEKNSSIIVLEDDIVTAEFFLSFCNQGLKKYNDDEHVAAISGYMFPVASRAGSAFFLPIISCWGWATWKRSWKKYDGNAGHLLQVIQQNNAESRFDLNNSYPYLDMLKMRAAGKINSWAVCWYASVFNRRGLMLYPPVSLVDNVGMDGSGTNFVKKSSHHALKITSLSAGKFMLPDLVEENKTMQKKVEKFLRAIHYPTITGRIVSKLRRSIKKFSVK